MGQPKPSQDQPSMDEILSSIRRIIERGESGSAQTPPAGPVRADETGQDGSEQDDDAAAAPFNGSAGSARAPMSDTELDSFAEALDARVSAYNETVFDATGVLADPQPPVDDAPGGKDDASGGKDDAPGGKYEARFTADDSRAFAEVANVLSATAGELRVGPGVVAAPVPHADADAPELQSAASPEPLISQDVSRAVGMSFDILSDMLRAQAGRDLQEIAEEMMRPMLADWLDNNLPSIVERLVRAEIERIARGEPHQG